MHRAADRGLHTKEGVYWQGKGGGGGSGGGGGVFIRCLQSSLGRLLRDGVPLLLRIETPQTLGCFLRFFQMLPFSFAYRIPFLSGFLRPSPISQDGDRFRAIIEEEKEGGGGYDEGGVL